MPTDEVMQFTAVAGAAPELPILAVDTDLNTFTVAGDHTASFPLENATFYVSGSTGNDGQYASAGGATYDPDTEQTTIATVGHGGGSPITDPTADGVIQPPIVYTATKVLPPNSAVEWVLLVTDVPWDGAGSTYWATGDSDDLQAFLGNGPSDSSGASDFSNSGIWQWPRTTLFKDGVTSDLPAINTPGYKLYPEGTTLTAVATAPPDNTVGSTRIVIHHHVTEVVAVPRNPPATP